VGKVGREKEREREGRGPGSIDEAARPSPVTEGRQAELLGNPLRRPSFTARGHAGLEL